MKKRVVIALNIMKDCQPHCMECLSKQINDKTDSGNHLWKQFEDEGFELLKKNGKNSAWKTNCLVCKKTTSHRQLLKSTTIYQQKGNLKRISFTKEDKIRIHKLFNNKCPIFGNTIAYASDIEIDHRIPANNNTIQEKKLKELTDKELVDNYMPLERHINQVKRNKCKECSRTKQRPTGPTNIKFWFKGNEIFNDDVKCDGCFWAYPEMWGLELNKKINK